MKRKSIPKRIKNVTIEQLYKETKKQVEETNRVLKRLEKGTDINKSKYNPKTKRYERQGTYIVTYASGKTVKMKPSNIISYKSNTWAGKKLRNKISSINNVSMKKGKIVLSKNIKPIDLTALNKAMKNFRNSKTSNVKGIKEIENRIKQTLKDNVDEFYDLSDEETELLYDFYNDKDYKYITQYIDPSELDVTLAETKAEDGDENDFLRKIENYVHKDSLYKDDDLIDALENIYNKFKEK